MNIALWIVQILLALIFLMAGVMKLMRTREDLSDKMAWVDDFGDSHIKLIGALEILGAIGLVLPAATGILPLLTPLAALGLALTMLGAAYTHIRRGEYPMTIMNVVLLLMALFVAYGRFVLVPL